MKKTLRKFVGPLAGSMIMGLGLAATPAGAQSVEFSPGTCAVFADGAGGTSMVVESDREEFRYAKVMVRKNDRWVRSLEAPPFRFRNVVHRDEVDNLAGSPEDVWTIRVWRDGNAYDSECSFQEQDTTAPVITDPGVLAHEIDTPAFVEVPFHKYPEFQLEAVDAEGGPVTFIDSGLDWEKLGMANSKMDASGKIVVDTDQTLPGTYDVTVRARDFQGNETSLKVKIVITRTSGL